MISARSGLEVLRAAAAQSGAAFDGTRLQRHEAPRHPGYEETGRTDWDRPTSPGPAPGKQRWDGWTNWTLPAPTASRLPRRCAATRRSPGRT